MVHDTPALALTQELFEELARVAWRVRKNARSLGGTKVGCAVYASDGQIFAGCNVEHKFRCHDIHAEVNAISSMIAAGSVKILAVVIVAEREFFTPCGGCMDWIMEFGTLECVVAFQAKAGETFQRFTAKQLMPFYPA